MKKWRVTLPGGRTFTMESDDPGAALIAQGHTAFALEEIFPTPPAWKTLPNSEKDSALLITVPEMAKLLQIGRDTAYQLTHRPDFPAIRVGRSVRINREGLQDWLNNQNGGIVL